jgi:hypothetical protein
MSGPKKGDAPSALFEHCCAVYGMMFDRAATYDPKDGSREMLVYEGKLTELVTGAAPQGLYLSVPYYTKTTRALKQMGCIRQLRRGGGTSPSQWELVTEPTLEEFKKLDGDVQKLGRANEYVQRQEFESLSQQLRDLKEVVDHHERAIMIIIKALPEE